MPIRELRALILAIVLASPAGLARALDEAQPGADTAAARMFQDPREAMSRFIEDYRAGSRERGLDALRYAANGGEPLARWKLGEMYARGEGVPKDEFQAYQYFVQIIENYRDNEPAPRERGIVASAYVAVGAFALKGIGERLPRDPERAMRMFTIAATEYRDPNAQYNLGRMYIDGEGPTKDARRGAQWLRLAAEKNHAAAQGLLGQIYFFGADGLQRQPAMGLMYLTLAREAAGESRANRWIVDNYDRAMAAASQQERQGALASLQDHLGRRR